LGTRKSLVRFDRFNAQRSTSNAQRLNAEGALSEIEVLGVERWAFGVEGEQRQAEEQR
jgi:hypothetical protein